MHTTTQDHRREWTAAALLILTAGAASYLTCATNLGFFGDDWYLVYAGQVGGFSKFFDVFASDRPFRAYFVGGVFEWFGLNAPLYSYLSYALRMTQAFGVFWLLRMVWPNQKRLAILLAVLFAVYPGWTDQPAAYDYQSHLLAFALSIFSLAMAVRAVHTPAISHRIILTAAAAVLELAYLMLMEYYIGLEGLRLVLLLYVCGSPNLKNLFSDNLAYRLRQTVKHIWPYLVSAGGFLVWRAFLFSAERSATNLGGIFSSLLGSPLHRGLWSLVYLVQDYLNCTILAWFIPLYQNAFTLRLRDALIALVLGAVVAGLIWVVWWYMAARQISNLQAPDKTQNAFDLFIIGSLGVIFSLIPIGLGYRHITFPLFSRFTLTGSLGAIMVLGSLLISLRQAWLRPILTALLVGLAIVANYGNTVHYSLGWQHLRDFWWQVSWRAPDILPETVIVADYSLTPIYEDYFVWGPANLVYYPEPYQPEGLTRTPLSSIVLTPENLQGILMGQELADRERRGIISSQDLGKVLVFSMPSEGSCVHGIDGIAPELSDQEEDSVARIAPHSKIERIITDVAPHIPPAALFGSEPTHGWCYYYEKASLARQSGDWAEVTRLGDEAMANDLRPRDWVEWMPFLQAYAYMRRYEDANRLIPIVATTKYLKYQACNLFTQDSHDYAIHFPAGQEYLRQAFCQ